MCNRVSCCVCLANLHVFDSSKVCRLSNHFEMFKLRFLDAREVNICICWPRSNLRKCVPPKRNLFWPSAPTERSVTHVREYFWTKSQHERPQHDELDISINFIWFSHSRKSVSMESTANEYRSLYGWISIWNGIGTSVFATAERGIISPRIMRITHDGIAVSTYTCVSSDYTVRCVLLWPACFNLQPAHNRFYEEWCSQ